MDINVVLCMLASKSEYQTDTAYPLVLSVLALSPLCPVAVRLRGVAALQATGHDGGRAECAQSVGWPVFSTRQQKGQVSDTIFFLLIFPVTYVRMTLLLIFALSSC